MNETAVITESNEDLLTAAGRGDDEAFHRLYQQTNRQVYAYLMRLLNNETLVKDVFVDTYSEIWKSAPKFRSQSPALSWMIGVARNLAMNRLKRIRHYDDIDEPTLELATVDDNSLEQQQTKSLVHGALAQLKPQHREIISLVLLQEYSYQMVADIMDIPLNTAKTRVFYAKELLTKKLTEMGISKNDIE
ncbi:MAG: sigma-70 family RNA polymerase sigma factor [Gammaproteobacteria bacterium]|nr:sigma-70 family RNA polymerase sigma factor [Gammaproteobacteria bacterium]